MPLTYSSLERSYIPVRSVIEVRKPSLMRIFLVSSLLAQKVSAADGNTIVSSQANNLYIFPGENFVIQERALFPRFMLTPENWAESNWLIMEFLYISTSNLADTSNWCGWGKVVNCLHVTADRKLWPWAQIVGTWMSQIINTMMETVGTVTIWLVYFAIPQSFHLI